MKPFFVLLVLGVWWFPWGSQAVTPGELSRQAYGKFQEGKYSEAIRDWGELMQMGFVNGDIYDNIASAYWRLGKVGQARRYFLTAADYAPRDPAIRSNLQLMAEKIDKRAPEEGPLALLKKLPFYRLSLNFSESLLCSAVLSVLFFGCLTLARLNNKRGFRFLALLLFLPYLWSLLQLTWRSEARFFSARATVLAPQAALLYSPVGSSKVLEELTEGTLVDLLKKERDFALVKTPAGREGWMEKKKIGEIP